MVMFGELACKVLGAEFLFLGDSPSGKAPGSGPGIRGFESLIPSHSKTPSFCSEFYYLTGLGEMNQEGSLSARREAQRRGF